MDEKIKRNSLFVLFLGNKEYGSREPKINLEQPLSTIKQSFTFLVSGSLTIIAVSALPLENLKT